MDEGKTKKRLSNNPKGRTPQPRDAAGNIIGGKPKTPRTFKALKRGDKVAPSRQTFDKQEAKILEEAGALRADAVTKAIKYKDKYTVEIGDRICLLFSTTTYSMATICKKYAHEGLPTVETVWGWMWKHPELLQKWLLARELKSHVLIDDAVEIADDVSGDFIIEDGVRKVNGENINRSKLRINTRMLIAAKYSPRFYGDIVPPDQTLRNQTLEQVQIQLEAIQRHTKEY